MAWCTVDDVKAIVAPESLTDAQITAAIDSAYDDLVVYTGTASQTPVLKSANKHLAAAYVLQRMKFNGELASSVKFGNSSQNNNIENDIEYHRSEAFRLVKLYKSSSSSFKILYGRVGINTVNEENIS